MEVRASTVSLRSSGGAEEGDEAEDGVWGVLRADVWCGRMEGEMVRWRRWWRLVMVGCRGEMRDDDGR